MREILFRGKRIRTDEDGVFQWVFGYFATHSMLSNPEQIIDSDGHWFDVDPDTVGQFTGLTDKNGVRIFEDDIVSFSAEEYFKGDGRLAVVGRHGEIVFCEGAFMILSENSYFALSKSAVKAYDLVVCGNVHNNPDLTA